jgi:hypothetical protein
VVASLAVASVGSLVALAALAAPTAVLAASPTPLAPGPLAPGLAPSPQTTATAPTTRIITAPQSTDTGLSGGGVAAIAVGAAVVLGGISFYIWRDARKRAPIRHRAAAATAGAGGAKQRVKPRKLSPAERRRRKRGRARR